MLTTPVIVILVGFGMIASFLIGFRVHMYCDDIRALTQESSEEKCYYVPLKDIKIQQEWTNTRIGRKKLNRKFDFYRKTGIFQSPILINSDFMLQDGYSSWVIAQTDKLDQVPVRFVEN